MKTLFTQQNHSTRTGALALCTVVVLGALAISAPPASADIVARGRIGGADIHVRLETPDRVIVHAPATRVVVRRDHDFDRDIRWNWLSREDHRVAARLSLLSGVDERRLLAQRSHGVSWKRVARFHGIHRNVLAQAQSHRPLRPAIRSWTDSCEDDDRWDDRRRGRRGKRG